MRKEEEKEQKKISLKKVKTAEKTSFVKEIKEEGTKIQMDKQQ